MDIELFESFFNDLPKYRIEQARKTVFQEYVSGWDKAIVFSKDLRASLAENLSIKVKGEVKTESSNSKKAIIKVSDKHSIETVLIKNKDGRNTICLSSQIGCPMGCLFCATGKMGFVRDLTTEEMLDQVLFWGRYIKENELGEINNLVFMGMGEPLLNYNNLLKAIKIINDPKYFGIGARRISISTIGIPSYIGRLAAEKIQFNVAWSLHATDDGKREKIMPAASQYRINEVLYAFQDYIKKTHRKVMVEYLMLKDFNDSVEEAEKLAKLLKGGLFMVNLLTYNETGKFKPSSEKTMNDFATKLKHHKIEVTIRKSAGGNIKAACGQLATEEEK